MSPPKTGKTSPTHFQINLGSSPVNKAQVCEWTDLHSEPCDPPPPHPNMLAMNRPQFRVLLPTHPNMLAMNGPVFRVPSPSPQICLQWTDLHSESCYPHPSTLAMNRPNMKEMTYVWQQRPTPQWPRCPWWWPRRSGLGWVLCKTLRSCRVDTRTPPLPCRCDMSRSWNRGSGCSQRYIHRSLRGSLASIWREGNDPEFKVLSPPSQYSSNEWTRVQSPVTPMPTH